jgi:Zn2+/Cd2+-exporting ATPase
MTSITRIDLPLLLPDIPDERDTCVARLESVIRESPGIIDIEVVQGGALHAAHLSLHFDPAVIALAEVERTARAAGATVTRRFGHLVLPIRVVDGEDAGRRIEDGLSDIEGVLTTSVNLAAQRVRIEFDRRQTSRPALEAALREMGYEVGAPAEPVAAQAVRPGEQAHAHVGCCKPKEPVAAGAGWYARNRELALSLVAGAFLMAGFVGEWWFGLSRPAAIGLYIVAYGFGGFDLVRHWAGALRSGRFSLDIGLLMLLASLGAAALGQWAEGALLLFLFSLAHALEFYALGRARNAIRALAELAPPTATVLRAGQEYEVPVERVNRQEIVLVRPASRIPVDGTVRRGRSAVDQSTITGESLPVEKAEGDEVFAGTINGDGALEIVTTRAAGDRTLDRVVRMVEEAQTLKAPTQQFTERFARIFVPSALVAVVLMMTLPPLLGLLDWATAFYRAMALLVASSPCALALGTPATVLAAIAQGARHGVLFKGGAHLEQLGSVQALAFDKTGTLTFGRPDVTDVLPADGVDAEELLAVAAAVERGSQHPLARAIVRHAQATRLTLAEAGELQSFTSRGVRSSIGDECVEVGNLRLWDDEQVTPPAGVLTAVAAMERAGRSVVVVRRGERWLGVIGVADRPRAGVRELVGTLRRLGIGPIIMLTGDNRGVGDAVGREIGVDSVHADLMPEDKLALIQDLRTRHGDVVMVGDGVNDAPALAHASVGIAMGGAGTAVALETADVALMSDDLDRLPFAIGLSRRARAIIRQNLYIALAVIAFLIIATVTGFVGLGLAVAVHEGSTLVVIVNALRLLRYREPQSYTDPSAVLRSDRSSGIGVKSPNRWSASLPAAVPLLCAVHCIAAPVLVLFAPALAPDSRVAAVLLFCTAVLTLFFLRWGVRSHGRRVVWIPATAGLVLWTGAHLSGTHGPVEIILEFGGAALVAWGLTWNAWLRHRATCDTCGCPAHEEAEAYS